MADFSSASAGFSDNLEKFQRGDNEPNEEKGNSSWEPQTPSITSKKRKDENIQTPAQRKQKRKKIRAKVVVDHWFKKKTPKRSPLPKKKTPKRSPLPKKKTQKAPESSVKIPATLDNCPSPKRRKYEIKATKNEANVQVDGEIQTMDENLGLSCKRSLNFNFQDSHEDFLTHDSEHETCLAEQSTSDSLISETQVPEISRWANRKNTLYYRRKNKRLALVNAFKVGETKSSSTLIIAKKLSWKKRRTIRTKAANSDLLKSYTNQIRVAVNFYSQVRFKSRGKRSARKARSYFMDKISVTKNLSSTLPVEKFDDSEKSMTEQLVDSNATGLSDGLDLINDKKTSEDIFHDGKTYEGLTYDWKKSEFTELKKIREPIKDTFVRQFDECQSQIPLEEIPDEKLLSLDRTGAMKKLVIDAVTRMLEGIGISKPDSEAFVRTGREIAMFNNIDQSLVDFCPSNPQITAKVAIDERSIKLWDLFENNEEREEEDEETEKLWKIETDRFAKLIAAFIKNMRGVLGNRKWSRWKGSVLDSLIGVFLTQNVVDVLSSSTFMKVVERFPYSSDPTERNPTEVTYLEYSPHNQEDSTRNTCQTVESEVFINEESTSCDVDSTKSEKEPVKKKKGQSKNKDSIDWREMRKLYSTVKAEDSDDTRNMVDWDRFQRSIQSEIEDLISARGMHLRITGKIMKCLKRLIDDFGSLDLEWLRNLPRNLAKEFLLSIEGVGLKSTECVRLLSLRQKAFPVDTNIARVTVRLNWVPIQELPEWADFHNIDNYPNFDNVQKYLWARLMDVPVEILYELHYILITFGKVFCTKSNPNCRECPMKQHCKYYASVNNSPMEEVEEVDIEDLLKPDLSVRQCVFPVTPSNHATTHNDIGDNVELPETEEILEVEPISSCYDGEFTESDDELYDYDDTGDDDNPTRDVVVSDLPKTQKTRLRTIHNVYIIPDEYLSELHLEQRVTDDPNPYLFARCPESSESPEELESSNERSIVPYNPTVYGTILIPCRTANGGYFPLNGTYFQINEVFADYETTINQIEIPRTWLKRKNLRKLYCGRSIRSIVKELGIDEITRVFSRDYMCLRGFDRSTRAPLPIPTRFHDSPPQKKKA